jgi:hypothetical protein
VDRIVGDWKSRRKRVTGGIRKLNGRLFKTARQLHAEARSRWISSSGKSSASGGRSHRIARTPPGQILTSFFRKAVNTSVIEALKE